jgi:hypothetical protein
MDMVGEPDYEKGFLVHSDEDKSDNKSGGIKILKGARKYGLRHE